MDKVILVIDDPMRCLNCPIARYMHMGGRVCGVGNKSIDVDAEVRPDWCPLKPAPEEQLVWNDDDDWVIGYNNCVHEIMGD